MTRPVDMTHAPVDEYVTDSVDYLTRGPALPHRLAKHLVLSAVSLGRKVKAGKGGGTIKAHQIAAAEYKQVARVIAATYGMTDCYWERAFFAHLEVTDRKNMVTRTELIERLIEAMTHDPEA